MSEPTKNTSISLADCLQTVSEDVFPLQSSKYSEKYPNWPGLVGIELEMHLWDAAAWDQNRAQQVPFKNKAASVSEILTEIAIAQGWAVELFDDENASPDNLKSIKLDHSDQITFEPGGQVEFSSSPYPCLSDANDRVLEIQKILTDGLAKNGVRIHQSGINPWLNTEEIGLQMDKPRYQAMDRYFKTISEYGKRMMRQTCTVQVNMDFGDCSERLAKRFLAANLIAPFSTAMFANSPFVNGVLSPEILSERAVAWRHLDASRTGIPPLGAILKKVDKESCVQVYSDLIMDSRVVFIEALDFCMPEKPLKFKEWVEQGYRGIFPTRKDFDTQLTLFFPEVRAKGFLELRSVDCQAVAWQLVPAAFFTALLYDDENLDKIIERIGPMHQNMAGLLEKASFGLRDEDLFAGAKYLGELALGGITRLPACFRGKGTEKTLETFMEHFCFQQRTPADDIKTFVEKSNDKKVLPGTLQQIDEYWVNLIE